MRVVVIGGSAAGLIAAVMLARAGHPVTVLEADHLEPAADVESAAAAAFRAAAPQLVQPHVVLAACQEVLQERLPDVYTGLLDAGVLVAPLASQMPPTLADRAPAPGDERLQLFMTRRATVDWVVGRAAAAEPGVDLRFGVRVDGLLADPDDPPRVRGVHTDHGDLRADVVVDTAGRRSPLDRWLDGIGARRSDVRRAECGVAYFSRQYRLRGGELPGAPTTRVVVGLDEFTVGIWGGDNGTMQLLVAPLAGDRRFAAARDPAVYTAVLRTVPFYADWLDVLDPITGVAVMGGLHNTLRRLVVDGRPVVVGLHAVGDTVCTTNPTFGRGLSLAARGAADLVDVLAAHPDDPYAQALAMDRGVDEHIAPWYVDQAATDAARLAVLRHNVLGGPPPTPADPGRVTFGQIRQAALVDAVAFRAVWKLMGLVGLPEDFYTDPDLVARVRGALADGVPAAVEQPTHEQLEVALAGTATAAR